MAFQSKQNARAIQAIIAVARAHTRLPGFEMTKAKDIARKIDAVVVQDRTMETTVALCLLLLRAIGVADFADDSRFRAGN